jgi:hypothetical protein
MSFSFVRSGAAVSVLALAIASPALSQDRGVSYTNFGTPGLIEMPSAISANDGEISGTLGYFEGELRNSFTFQITPWLSGTFRYAGVSEFDGPDTGTYYDRSFDLRYRFNDEGQYLPMIAVGLQDFMGTGLYSSEYVVATKTLSDSIRVTAGLGWGRLGTYNGFSNPLGVFSSSLNDRPDGFGGGETGGTPSLDSFFRGDAAFFGGLEWAASDKFTVKLEYSSDDAYRDRNGDPLLDRRSPINVGLTYRVSPAFQVGLSYLYGSELAFAGTILVNPANRPFPSGLDAPPQPVRVRSGGALAAQSWNGVDPSPDSLSEQLQDGLRMEGIDLHAVELTGSTARVRYTNLRYRSEAQALGRTARVLTQELPPSVETLTLEPMQNGIPLSATTLSRSDLERLENSVGGTDAILARAQIGEAGRDAGLTVVPSDVDPFSWGIAPYAFLILFNGDNPLQFAAGVELSAAYTFSPNLVFSGAIRQPLLRNSDDAEIVVDDNVPVVRRNSEVYTEQGSPGIDYLTLAHYGRPAHNVYSRVTVGYLERMYGGISTELLYKPVNANWAVGVEANYVAQRDFDMLLGFQDYEVATGHGSFYYAFENGFLGQIDVGRYLAGDWGATFGIDREFNNGWRVGAYFTLTDMPFEDYGEGSFDKGIRIVIPTDFIFGTPTRSETGTTLQSLTRDGGARLEVDGRLYDVVRDGHTGELTDSWGRFWR